MEIPFYYGKIVGGKDFTDRENDITHLHNNLAGHINTALISPRRWGKTSLVEHVLADFSEEEFLVIKFDALAAKDEDTFYHNYLTAINASAKLGRGILELLPIVHPKLIVRTGVVDCELDFTFDHKKDAPSIAEILDLPQKIAEKTGKHILVCIDEFQNIGEYDDTLSFQRTLRTFWQRQPDVTYCLYGSKFNMMTSIFADPRMPFYKFGDMFYLKKIDTSHWVEFIASRFSETGKLIGKQDAELIARLCENHPYYVQQLSQLTWFRTVKKCSRHIVEEAFKGLLAQLEMQFILTASGLQKTQTEYLRALCDNMKNMSATSTLASYKIGTSANVKNIRKTLEKKELITIFPETEEFQDPIFKYWLKNVYFKSN